MNNGELAGIVLLHKISDIRTSGTYTRNHRLFANLCGHEVMKNVVVATTMWGAGVSEAKGQMRLKELKEGWSKEGCAVKTVKTDGESAWEIINHVLDLPPCPRLPVQGTTRSDTNPSKATGRGWAKTRTLLRKGLLQ